MSMPLSPRRRAAALTSLAVAAGLALAALPASPAAAATVPPAAVPCATRTATTPFTQWGDQNAYFTLPGADFEAGTPGWTLSKAATTTENEPWKVISGTKARSLQVAGGGSAGVPTFCVSPHEALVRFFYKSPGVPGSYLVATITSYRVNGTTTAEYWFEGSTAGWAVTPALWIPNVMDAGAQSTVSVTFTQRNVAATWKVDDFQVDPWKTK